MTTRRKIIKLLILFFFSVVIFVLYTFLQRRGGFQAISKPKDEKFGFSMAKINQDFNPVPTLGSSKAYKLDLGNQVFIEMISIPGGKVKLGTSDSERSPDEEPLDVTVKQFYMSRYPITQAQWRKVAKLPTVNRELKDNPSTFGSSSITNVNLPVETISWEEAKEFCDRISEKFAGEYRLPEEKEWEYACRAGTTTPFHFGETITPEVANYDCNYFYRSGQDAEPNKYQGKTILVNDIEAANQFGLEGMHGNVWEWCEDIYSETHEKALNNTNSEGKRVIRGGAWNSFPQDCRSAKRNSRPQTVRINTIGFRIVCIFEES